MKNIIKLKGCLIMAAIFLSVIIPDICKCESSAGHRLKIYFKDVFLQHLASDTKNLVNGPENWACLSAGTAMTVASHQYQWDVNEYWKDNSMGSFADFGNDFWGEGVYQGLIALSMFSGGMYLENEKMMTTGEVLVEAQIIQGILINVIKPIAGKKRPDGSDDFSFPSGHTGTAFCTAAVLHDRYGWKYGAPAYAFAIITAMARMDVQAHWLPDTVMGATIATIVGYSVSSTHDDYPWETKKNKTKVAVMPFVNGKSAGLTFTIPL
jgi:PAP2 superfamily protein